MAQAKGPGGSCRLERSHLINHLGQHTGHGMYGGGLNMSDMNATPVASRLHIAIFGRRNAGKSSIINAVTNQPIALVSDVPGTTTDGP